MSDHLTTEQKPVERVLAISERLAPNDRAALLGAIGDLLDFHAELLCPDVILRQSTAAGQPTKARPGAPVNVIRDDAKRFHDAAAKDAATSPTPPTKSDAPNAGPRA